jgi:hypothetical protein
VDVAGLPFSTIFAAGSIVAAPLVAVAFLVIQQRRPGLLERNGIAKAETGPAGATRRASSALVGRIFSVGSANCNINATLRKFSNNVTLRGQLRAPVLRQAWDDSEIGK